MTTTTIEADYVIVGGGAVGMSFADVVLSESDADMIIVDRRARPGGHWVDAYSFVRLHLPSSFYGVNSKPLGRGRRDTTGLNAGLLELATGDEIRTYYDELLRDRFLPSGRVRYLPMSDYADGRVTSLLNGDTVEVRARRKTVDARYVGSEVPSTRPPSYRVAPDVHLVPVNGLATIAETPGHIVIVGGGKTGADACTWLLEQGTAPDDITWVRSREPWFYNRANMQSGPEFFEQSMGGFVTLLEAAARSETLDAFYASLEEAGLLMRIDPDYWPTMCRLPTVTRAEIELLRQVTDVVRLGRVESIDRERMTLEQGTVPVGRDWLFVDCTAPGLRPSPPIPIFDGDRVTPQYVLFGGFPTYSAALVAYVELTQDEDDKNTLCRPLPVTGNLDDLARNLLGDIEMRARWLASPEIAGWMAGSRLDPLTGPATSIDPTDETKMAILGRYLAAIEPARSRMAELVGAVAAA